MSYIRCLCNPECLYVYGGENAHEFSWIDRRGKHQFLSIPNDDFNEFFKRFKRWDDFTAKECHDLDCETFEHKGIQLKTVFFNEGTKQIMTTEEYDAIPIMEHNDIVNHLICLTYKDYPPLLMWEVTWDRLRNSVYYHLFKPCWLVRKINKWFGYDKY